MKKITLKEEEFKTLKEYAKENNLQFTKSLSEIGKIVTGWHKKFQLPVILGKYGNKYNAGVLNVLFRNNEYLINTGEEQQKRPANAELYNTLKFKNTAGEKIWIEFYKYN